ncbi:hypothetical protein Dsin_007806 [Dipteronia sinensis]|uniref:GDT1 family protein n=1 Tax=Dipteronia sinensis TaxID=43782 RepID=A0AAE0B2I2_9ROSI|nr:hypothetical protein Dsin_007806 [Dipteronia sinensis]
MTTMRSLTLSWSGLKAHSLHPSPKRHRTTPLVSSLNSLSENRTSKLSLPAPILTLSWDSRLRFAWRIIQTLCENEEVGCVDCKYRNAIREPTCKLDDCCVSDNSLAKIISSRREYHTAIDFVSSNPLFGGFTKFMMFFGLLTLQGSQPAIAGTDFGSGLQSIPFFGDLGDISTGFASAFLLIFFSELGDKTFFIAALLAARNSAAIVFAGTFGALAAMTIVSVILGRTFHYVDEILPFRFGETDLPIDDIAAVCLLVYFGVSTLLDATSGDGLKAEDEQKEAELAVSDFSGNGAGILAAANTIISTFLLVFVAEWGDKSFFSTIALAAASSPLGVIGRSTGWSWCCDFACCVGRFFTRDILIREGNCLHWRCSFPRLCGCNFD